MAPLDAEARIEFLRRDHWLGYAHAKAALGKLQSLIDAGPRHRSPGLLVVSESNNGKSRIGKRICELNPASEDPQTGRTVLPALFIEMPAAPDESRLYDEILVTLWQPFRSKDPVGGKQHQVVATMRQLGVRLLVIDELQNILGARKDRRRPLLDAIRYLSNQCKVPVAAMGMPEVMVLLASYPSVINRLQAFELPLWGLNDDFRTLVSSFERIIPLRERSRLTSVAMTSLLHDMTGGRIGELRDLLVEATETALRAGEERITMDLLRGLYWSSPDDRRRSAEAVKVRIGSPR